MDRRGAAEKVLIADSHMHTNPVRGMGAGTIAERFKASGGWFAAIVGLSPWSYGFEPPSFEAYMKTAEIVMSQCREAAEKGLKVKCFTGFHPADVDRLIDKYRLKPEKVLELGLDVVSKLKEMCSKGLVDGIGEVGRQHYRTGAERVSIAEAVMSEALMAVEEGCMVQLHLEQSGEVTVTTIDRLYRILGLPESLKRNVIFHHASLKVAGAAYKLGYSSSLPGIPRLLEHAAFNSEPVYMVESDFIDNPSRPGVVVYPWVMADKIRELAAKGAHEWAYKVNVDNVVRVYGVEPP